MAGNLYSRYLRGIKNWNSLKFRVSRKLKLSRALNRPRKVEFVITQRCNGRCIMCAYTPKGDSLGYDDIKKIAKTTLPYAREVILIGGEPLMHPDFFKISQLVSGYQCRLGMTTNLSYLGGDREEAVRRFFTGIIVSIDAASERTYQHIRTGLSFNKLLQNLETLARISRETGLKITVNTVVMRQNLEEIPGVVKLVAGLGFYEMELSFACIREKLDLSDSLLFHREEANQVFARAAEVAEESGLRFRFPGFFDLKQPPFMDPGAVTDAFRICVYPWNTMRVLTDGTVVPCCILYELPMGNILEAGSRKIWNNQKYRQLRRSFRKGLGMPSRCRHCRLLGKRNPNDALIHVGTEPGDIEGMRKKLEKLRRQ
jgi:radical SAM protein with 4Fe4S-binding SPASM domain